MQIIGDRLGIVDFCSDLPDTLSRYRFKSGQYKSLGHFSVVQQSNYIIIFKPGVRLYTPEDGGEQLVSLIAA